MRGRGTRRCPTRRSAPSAAVASRNSASEISDIRSATRNTSGPRGRTPIPTSGCLRPSSSRMRLDRSAAPAGRRTSPPRWAAATPRRRSTSRSPAAWPRRRRRPARSCPTARSRKNASASTISTMPTVNTNSARPRRVRLECRMPAHATRVSASSTYSSGSSQGSELPPEPRLRFRYSSGDISGCCPPQKNTTRLTDRDHGGDAVLRHRDLLGGRRGAARRRRW